MPRLLIVHHTASPALQAILEAVLSGATDPAIEGVEVVRRPALAATAMDVLTADAVLVGRPYGLYVHGNSDTGGAVRAVESIAGGLRWRRAAEPVTVLGTPTKADLERCWELGAVVAAGLDSG